MRTEASVSGCREASGKPPALPKQETSDLRPGIDGVQQIVLCGCHPQAFHAALRAVVPAAVTVGSIGAGQVLHKSQRLH